MPEIFNITKEAQVSRANAKCYGTVISRDNTLYTLKRGIRWLISELAMIDRPFIYIQLNYTQPQLITNTLNSFFRIVVHTFHSQHTEFLPVHWIYSDSESQCWHCRVMYHSWNATATLFPCSSAVDTLNCHICFHTSAAHSGQRFSAALSPFSNLRALLSTWSWTFCSALIM